MATAVAGLGVAFVSRGVYEERLERVRAYCAAEGLAAYVAFGSENINYLSGFMPDVAPWERPIACIVPCDAAPVLLLNELSTNHIRFAVQLGRCAVPDYRLYVEHPRAGGRLPLRVQWGAFLADTLRSTGVTRGGVGVDGTVPHAAEVRVALPQAEFVPASEVLREMRLVKHAEELDLIRAGGAITDATQEFYRTQIAPGRLLCDVDGLAQHFMLTYAVARCPGARIEARVFAYCGPESACPHGPGGNADMRLAAGQALINLVILRLNGYVTENERTFFVGEPADDLARAYDAMTEAQQAAIDAMRVPNRVCDFDAAAQTVIERAGFGAYINHRTGHGIGLAGHEYPDDTAFNYRPLAPHMVFSAEPGIYLPDRGGVRHDDTVIVTDAAPEVVTRYPRDRATMTVRA